MPPTPYSPPPSPIIAPTAAIQRNAGGQAIVIDNSVGVAPGERTGSQAVLNRGSLAERASAGALANRNLTVPQGTLIQAVLETAFDSTSPGFARALVQRDVRGFDGSLVLIPRGSRLIGEYGTETAAGQNRVRILWARLIRPDGVTMDIGSPAADPLGRGGVKADVDSHFLAQFAGAILQSTLDVGVGLATRRSRYPVVVALPGSSQSAGGGIAQPASIPPTLKVAAATSISVFVARDLDFSGTADRP